MIFHRTRLSSHRRTAALVTAAVALFAGTCIAFAASGGGGGAGGGAEGGAGGGAGEAKKYAAPVDQKIDPAKTYTATIKTARGDLHIKLFPEAAPKHVNSFVFLAREHFYDGLIFHRYVPGFVIQGGDPEGTGGGGPGYNVPLETKGNPHLHDAGALGMARSQDLDSAGSQFYLCLADVHQLDVKYTVFGQLDAADMPTLMKLEKGDVMTSVTIDEK